MAAWATSDEIRFALIDPDDSPWSGSPLLAHQLNAEEASVHAKRREFLAVAEAVIDADRSISDHIHAYTQATDRGR